MKSNLTNLTYEIELKPGEKFMLPEALVETVGPGRWILTVTPRDSETTGGMRDHRAFLSGYAAEDEVLYDDNPAR